MIRGMNWTGIGFASTLTLLLAWGEAAQAQTYTVHQATVRLRVAYEDCFNDVCNIVYGTINTRNFVRGQCQLGLGGPVPAGYVAAAFLSCEEYPELIIGVWDKLNDEHVCDDLGTLSIIAAAHDDTNQARGNAELLFGGLPAISGRGTFGPLPARLEYEDTCWLRFRSAAVDGTLLLGSGLDEVEAILTDGDIRAGNPLAIYTGNDD